MNSFSILGITPDAGPAEIKRAYRRLAMAWHPDRNPHPEATERFKQIRAAYDALQAREAGSEEAGGSAAAAASETPRAADIRLDLAISLEEGAFGCEKDIQFQRGTPCSTCEGSGEAGISRSRPCSSCHGSGRTRHRYHGLERCPDCDGRGFISQRTCPACHGQGKELAGVSLRVTVPPGMLPGDELRLAGQGESGSAELAAGDLFLNIRFTPHPLFTLDRLDLVFSMPVGVLTLLAGGTVKVPVLGGFDTLELEPGDPGPRTVRRDGRGYPGRRSSQAGDLVIHLEPVWPQQLNARQRKLLREAAQACEESLPEVTAWRRRYGL